MTGDKELGNRLKQIRKALRLRQVDFAKQLNMSGPSLSELETGKYKPGFDCLMTLSLTFKVNLYYVFFGEGEMFLDGIGQPSSPSPLAVDNEDVRKFLWYFERSSIIRYHMLSVFQGKLFDEEKNIAREIEAFKQKNGESTEE